MKKYLVELIGTADVGQHNLAIDTEDEALHDLADLHTDRRRSVGCRLRAFGKRAGHDGEAAIGSGLDHSGHVRV